MDMFARVLKMYEGKGTHCFIGLFFSTAIIWRWFNPLITNESSRAQRKAIWKEEKKFRKINNPKQKQKTGKKQNPGLSRTLWTVPEDGQRLGNATLAESIRLEPATLVKNSRSNDKLFEMGESAMNHKTSFIYVIGGRLRGKTLTNVERFNLTTYTWEKCANLKENRGSHGAGVLNGTVYAVGGGGLRSNLRSCEKLDADGVWISAPSISVPRHALCVVSVPERNGNKACLYSIGGWSHGAVGSSLMEKFENDQWLKCASLEMPRRLHGACYCPIDGCIYVFGGNVDDHSVDSRRVDCYIPIADKWEKRKPLPLGACCCAVTIGERYVYVALFGRGIVRYDPITDSYCSETITPLPLEDWHGFSMVSAVSPQHRKLIFSLVTGCV